MERSDADLVRDVLGGDRVAYGELYDRYAGLIRSISYDATLDLTAAQDLAQEVFLRAYGRLDRLRDPDRFASWLIGVARHVCREWRRARSRDPHRYVGVASGAEIAEPSQREDASAERLRRAIAELPEKERMAVHAFYLEERTAEQVRSVLGLSTSGLYRVLERARKRLAAILRRTEELML